MFEKIKNLKGLFYRKLKEKPEKIEEALPGFTIKNPRRITEFPNVKDVTKINIIYPLIEPFAYANIKWDEKIKEVVYKIIEPELSKKEEELLKKISDALIELIEVSLSGIKNESKAISYLETQVNKVLKQFGLSISPVLYVKLMYYIYRNFVGLNEIEPLMQDPNIEDISCDGLGTPIYIIHRKYGSLKTNIVFKDLERLRALVVKLSERCGRYISYAEPILAGTLPDGSRVSATIAGDIATKGPTFTIRKFGLKPLSPIDQIELKTASPEMMAYFWYLVEHGASMLIVGGVSTGKTSFLNSIAMFIPPEAKIVSIEDTRELRFPHEHWIPGLARVGFGVPLPTGQKYGEVTLFDLLKESFRQNPDYVVVGEVRGEETYVMFQGMSSGHPSLSTFHAGSLPTVIKRLTTPPINLSPMLIESLDVIVIMTHAREKGKSARRVREVYEIVSVDPKTDEINTNLVFRWDPVTDTFKKVNDSVKIEKFASATGARLEDALKEIERRKKIIEWMYKNGIKDFSDVTKLINEYYKEPEKVLKRVEYGIIPIKPSVKSEAKIKKEKKKRTSILELLGLKIFREK